MKMLINEAKGKLKVGDWVRTDAFTDAWGNDSLVSSSYEGVISEIYSFGFKISKISGRISMIFKISDKDDNSFMINWKQTGAGKDAYIEIIKGEPLFYKVSWRYRFWFFLKRLLKSV